MYLQLTSVWKDHRVQFSHLQNSSEDNVIPNSIWNPIYQLPTILFKDYISYTKRELGQEQIQIIRETLVKPSIDGYGFERKKTFSTVDGGYSNNSGNSNSVS